MDINYDNNKKTIEKIVNFLKKETSDSYSESEKKGIKGLTLRLEKQDIKMPDLERIFNSIIDKSIELGDILGDEIIVKFYKYENEIKQSIEKHIKNLEYAERGNNNSHYYVCFHTLLGDLQEFVDKEEKNEKQIIHFTGTGLFSQVEFEFETTHTTILENEEFEEMAESLTNICDAYNLGLFESKKEKFKYFAESFRKWKISEFRLTELD